MKKMLPDAHVIAAEDIHSLSAQISNSVASPFADLQCPSILTNSAEPLTIRKVLNVQTSPSTDWSFSTFVVSLDGSAATIDIGLHDHARDVGNWETKTLSAEWQRITVSYRFPQPPGEINISLRVTPAHGRGTRFAICHFQLDKSLYSSSPFLEDTRSAEKISRHGDIPEFAGDESGHILIAYKPLWSRTQLKDGQYPAIFDASSENGEDRITIFHNGEHNGEIEMSLTQGGRKTAFLSKSDIPRDNFYALNIDWNKNGIKIFINGIQIMSTSNRLFTHLLSSLYIGSSHDNNYESLDGYLQTVKSYRQSLNLHELKLELMINFPEYFSHFRTEMIPQVSIGNDCYEPLSSEVILLIETVGRWCTDVNEQCELRIEVEFRRNLATLLRMSGYIVAQEDERITGRTDIAVSLSYSKNNIMHVEVVRIELKLWGANDYRDVPTKPLKYMNCMENFGMFLMIAPDGNAQRCDDFKKFTSTNATYRQVAVSETPYGERWPFHFDSIHFIDFDNKTKRVLCILVPHYRKKS